MRVGQASGWLVLFVIGFFGFFDRVHAHKASDAYFVLSEVNAQAGGPNVLRMQLSLALKDVDAALDSLDADNDRRLTWGEVQRATPGIIRWVSNDVHLQCAGQTLGVSWTFETLERRSDGAYIRLGAPLSCPLAAALSLDYRLMKDIDPTHRLLLSGALGGKAFAAVLAPQGRPSIVLRQASTVSPPTPGADANPGAITLPAGQAVAAEAPRQLPQSGPATLAQFFDEGVHHILTGYDHLAFLLALLLPVVLYRRVQREGSLSPQRMGTCRLARAASDSDRLHRRAFGNFGAGHAGGDFGFTRLDRARHCADDRSVGCAESLSGALGTRRCTRAGVWLDPWAGLFQRDDRGRRVGYAAAVGLGRLQSGRGSRATRSRGRVVRGAPHPVALAVLPVSCCSRGVLGVADPGPVLDRAAYFRVTAFHQARRFDRPCCNLTINPDTGYSGDRFKSPWQAGNGR